MIFIDPCIQSIDQGDFEPLEVLFIKKDKLPKAGKDYTETLKAIVQTIEQATVIKLRFKLACISAT